jgi:hypothetical protein
MTSKALQVTRQDITELLNDLPPESMAVVKQFVEFLREQTRRGQPVVTAVKEQSTTPYLYPSVAAPAASLLGWTNLLVEGYGGDALADTEALYDKV